MLYQKKEGWWISLCLTAIRCDCRYFVKKSKICVFPDGTNAFGKKREHCSLRFVDSAKNIVLPATQIKVYLERKGLYLSRAYFVVHSKCDLLDLDFINSNDISFDYSSNFANNLQP